jgi:tetratricopeptide (TPR) repeat protein
MVKAFFSYRYSLRGESIASQIDCLLHTLGVELIDGKHLTPPQEVSELVKSIISQCDFLVCLHLNPDDRSYLDREVAVATNCHKPIIILTADNFISELLRSDFYIISLREGEIQAAALMVAAINSIKSKLVLAQGSGLMSQSWEKELDAEQWTLEVRTRLKEIRQLFDCLDYQRSLDKADRLFSLRSDCWRAGIAKSAALMFLNRFAEADGTLEELIVSFAGNPRALSHVYQNKAWLEYININGLVEHRERAMINAINYFQRSIDCEPRLIVYVDAIVMLLQADRIHESETLLLDCLNHFPNAIQEFHAQVRIKGADFLQQLAKSSILMKMLFPKERSRSD